MNWYVVAGKNKKVNLQAEVQDINRIDDKIAVSLGIGDKRFCVEKNAGLFVKDLYQGRVQWVQLFRGSGEIDIFRKDRAYSDRVEVLYYGIGFKDGEHLQVSPQGELLNVGHFLLNA